MQDRETLVDGDVAGIGWKFQLLAEDIMEEVEAVADEQWEQWFSQELEEKTVKACEMRKPIVFCTETGKFGDSAARMDKYS